MEEALLLLQEQASHVVRVEAGRSRLYRVQGHDLLLPSVTSITRLIAKEGLPIWYKRMALEGVFAAFMARRDQGMEAFPIEEEALRQLLAEAESYPEQERQAAADFGSELHAIISDLLMGTEVAAPPAFAAAVAAFRHWQDTAGLHLTLFASELPVYSLQYGYAGTVDAVGWREHDGVLVALDWKSGKGIYREYALQVAAYAAAIEEMTGIPVAECWVVRLGKDRPLFVAREVRDWRAVFEAFKGLLALYGCLRHDPFGRTIEGDSGPDNSSPADCVLTGAPAGGEMPSPDDSARR
jgi:ATP-dependent exoDNAse (exonuclease V) beta subunit